MRRLPGTFAIPLGIFLTVAACLMAVTGPAAQQIDEDVTLSAGRQNLERSSDLSVSPTGEQIAVCDPSLNRIAVVDYTGRPLWSVGEQINLDQPQAVCFLPDNELLFSARANSLIQKVTRDNPTVLDTIADLSPWFRPDQHIDRMIASKGDRFLVLDETGGRVLRFDSTWKLIDIPITNGSGKGKVLVPTAMAVLKDGRIVVTDRKNFPAQMFGPDGRVLFTFGWNDPAGERGWEATAVGVDARDVIWVADETNSLFRLFDQAGTAIVTVPFPDPLFRPIAMTGTIDNRMLVIDDRGRAIFYTLQ